MTVEIEGEVVKSGRPKPYGGNQWSDKPTLKFFMEVEADDGTHYKTMVSVRHKSEREREAWNYHGTGDRVRYTVQRTKNEDDEGAIWTTGCTFKREFERLTTDGFDAWKEVKDKEEEERKAKKQAKREAQKEHEERLKTMRDEAKKQRLANESDDPRIPDDVAGKISTTFDIDQITKLLNDLAFFKGMGEGQGGKRMVRRGDGWKVGTGLRRPHGALYDMPKTWRHSILNKATETGIIEAVTDDDDATKYVVTSKGLELLGKLNRCPKCGGLKRPHHVHWSQQTGHRSRITGEYIVFACPDCTTFNTSSSGSHQVSVGRRSYPTDVKEAIEAVDVDLPEYIMKDDSIDEEIKDARQYVQRCLYTCTHNNTFQKDIGGDIPEDVEHRMEFAKKKSLYGKTWSNNLWAYLAGMHNETLERVIEELNIDRENYVAADHLEAADFYEEAEEIVRDIMDEGDDVDGDDTKESPPEADVDEDLPVVVKNFAHELNHMHPFEILEDSIKMAEFFTDKTDYSDVDAKMYKVLANHMEESDVDFDDLRKTLEAFVEQCDAFDDDTDLEDVVGLVTRFGGKSKRFIKAVTKNRPEDDDIQAIGAMTIEMNNINRWWQSYFENHKPTLPDPDTTPSFLEGDVDE